MQEDIIDRLRWTLQVHTAMPTGCTLLLGSTRPTCAPFTVQEVFLRAPTNIRIDKIIDELTDDGSRANAVFLKVVSERLKQSVAGLQHVNQVRVGLVCCHVDCAHN